MMANVFDSEFAMGDRVSIDDGNIAGVVIGIAFYPVGQEVKVSWWNNGSLHDAWVAAWRCKRVIA